MTHDSVLLIFIYICNDYFTKSSSKQLCKEIILGNEKVTVRKIKRLNF